MTEDELLNSDYAKEQAEISKKRARETAVALKPWDEIVTVIGDINYLTAESIEILKQRGQEFHDENRLGEKMFCRDDGYKFFITSKEVAALLGKHIRTAQEILQANRLALGKGKNDHVTIKEFCKLNHLPEEDTRNALKYIDPGFNTD
ncbi:MAG TPA: hypothetical protein VF008_10560 [Niastella sp.]